MITTAIKWLALTSVVLLAGCANQSMPGYQRVYQGYQVPGELLNAVQSRLFAEGVKQAVVGRDSVGRVQLNGTYRNEDEVERSFIITQSIVGIQSTSPFYPVNIIEKRWSSDAGVALSEFYKRKRQLQSNAPGKKRALVVGISRFMDSAHLPEIQGEDDARLMGMVLANYGYDVVSVLGERATKVNIEAAIAQVEQAIGPNDTLFIYVSSHGTQPVPTSGGGDERRMSIAAYDSGYIEPSMQGKRDKTAYLLNLQQTSVRDTLFQALAQKPSAMTRVIIDTCYSGEILKGLPSVGAAYQDKMNAGGVEKASVSSASWTGASFTSKAIAVVDDSQQSGIPAKANKTAEFATRKSYSFITATGPGEQSYGPHPTVGTFDSPISQGELLRGSFFTQSFIAYLKQFSGDISRAFDASRMFTASKVVEITKGLQQNPRYFTTIQSGLDNLAKN